MAEKINGGLVVSTAYFAPTELVRAIVVGGAVVEAHENFQKHSPRNRAQIMTATGVQTLSVPVVGGRGIRSLIRDVRVDYSTNFQRQHLRAIETAYRPAPYFDHFYDQLRPLFELRCEFLLDLNTTITEKVLEILRHPQPLSFTTEYCGVSTLDGFSVEPYYQVFADRIPYTPGLSILDWIFCQGFLE